MSLGNPGLNVVISEYKTKHSFAYGKNTDTTKKSFFLIIFFSKNRSKMHLLFLFAQNNNKNQFDPLCCSLLNFSSHSWMSLFMMVVQVPASGIIYLSVATTSIFLPSENSVMSLICWESPNLNVISSGKDFLEVILTTALSVRPSIALTRITLGGFPLLVRGSTSSRQVMVVGDKCKWACISCPSPRTHWHSKQWRVSDLRCHDARLATWCDSSSASFPSSDDDSSPPMLNGSLESCDVTCLLVDGL